MTVSTEPAALSYSGDGATATFAITWKYFAKAHVVVTLRDSAGSEATWVLGTQYTLTDEGISTGGTLTVVTAPVDYTPAANETLLIELIPPNTQDSSLPLGGPFPSSTVEDELDEAAQRDAKLTTVLDRALLVPKTDTQAGSNLEIPIDSARASKFLSFDANGKPIVAAGTSANLGPVSAYIDTLLDDSNFVTAITTLGLQPHYALGSVAGTNTITATAATTLTAHVAGDLLTFVPANDSTGAVTLNVDTIGAGAIQLNGAALVSKELQSGMPVTVRVTNTTPLFEILGGEPLARRWTQGADVISATDLLINIPGNEFDVTGTTTIATLATKGIGTVVVLQFDAALTLAHDAANLDLGSADIVTAASDVAVFYEYASADWRLISYTYAADRRRVDSTGAVTNTAQPCFRAHNSVLTDKTGNNTLYTMIFDTEAYDQNADFDGTSTFTAPITGKYLLTAQIGYSGLTASTSDTLEASIITSNDSYIGKKSNSNLIEPTDFLTISIVADMDSADTAVVKILIAGEAGDVADFAAGESHFSGVLVA